MDIYGHVIAGSGRKASERFIEALKQAIMLDSGNTRYETDWYIN